MTRNNLCTWEACWILYLSIELETDLLCFYPIKSLRFVGYNNYWARFDTHSYHCFRETHFNARLDIKSWQSHSSMKSRSKALSHSACLKSIPRTITVQGLTFAAITAAEKHTLMLILTFNLILDQINMILDQLNAILNHFNLILYKLKSILDNFNSILDQFNLILDIGPL